VKLGVENINAELHFRESLSDWCRQPEKGAKSKKFRRSSLIVMAVKELVN
jgi:hypothetical protein